MGILVPIVLFIVIAWIIKILSDNQTRRLLISKGLVNEDAKYLYMAGTEHLVPSSLKWGMVLIALGSAIFIGKLLANIPGFWKYSYNNEESLIFGLMFIFGGIALIVFHAMARKLMKEAERNNIPQ